MIQIPMAKRFPRSKKIKFHRNLPLNVLKLQVMKISSEKNVEISFTTTAALTCQKNPKISDFLLLFKFRSSLLSFPINFKGFQNLATTVKPFSSLSLPVYSIHLFNENFWPRIFYIHMHESN